MKKLAISIVCLLALSFAAVPAGAQTRARCTNSRTSFDRRYDRSTSTVYNNQVYRNNNYSNDAYSNNSAYGYDGYYDNRSTWERSRDKITTGIGAGAGAAVGAVAGGTRGAVIGAIVGGGGAALYTYVLRDRHNYRY